MRYAVIGSSDWTKRQLWFGWATTAEKLSISIALAAAEGALLCVTPRLGPGADEPGIILTADWKRAGVCFCWGWTIQNVIIHTSPWVHVTMVTFRICGPVAFVSTCESEHTNCSAEKVNQAKAAGGWVSCLLHTEIGVMEAHLLSHTTDQIKTTYLFQHQRSGPNWKSSWATKIPEMWLFVCTLEINQQSHSVSQNLNEV